MTEPAKKLSREDVALVELGETRVGRSVALLLIAALLVTIVTVPIVQHVYEWSHGESPQVWSVFTTVPSERAYSEFERELEDRSIVGKEVLPPMQRALAAFGAGNEQAYLGPDGWLFYRPGFDYVTGHGFLEPDVLRKRRLGGKSWQEPPQPDPVPAIVDFRDQLRRRNIELLLMPTTVKAQLDPTGTVPAERLPLNNSSYADWLKAMQAAGVRVFDPANVLKAQELKTQELKTQGLKAQGQAFLKTDTHWTAAAMRAVANALAATVRDELPSVPDPGYRSRTVTHANVGDIATMLRLPEGQQLYGDEQVTLEVVEAAEGAAWQVDEHADVLVLGDSFSNIYSLESMGWGAGAGFVEALSLALQRPLDRITINDAGAVQTRRALRDELQRGRDRLAGKKLVIWQFAIRELAVGDWQLLELPEVASQTAARSTVEVRARVVARSTPPQPGSVPYRDCMIAVWLELLQDKSGSWPVSEDKSAVLVYLDGMRDNVWTAAASLAIGSEVDWSLVPWEATPEAVRSLNRRELDDDALLLANPWYVKLP